MNKFVNSAVLLASASAVRLTDAPPHFNEPTWNESYPSAGGFAQVKDAPPYFNEPTFN